MFPFSRSFNITGPQKYKQKIYVYSFFHPYVNLTHKTHIPSHKKISDLYKNCLVN